MRISDWSSDVCSSDLLAAAEKVIHACGASVETALTAPSHRPPLRHSRRRKLLREKKPSISGQRPAKGSPCCRRNKSNGARSYQGSPREPVSLALSLRRKAAIPADRQSVRSGKRVSVRV